jgi:hypothetical protein
MLAILSGPSSLITILTAIQVFHRLKLKTSPCNYTEGRVLFTNSQQSLIMTSRCFASDPTRASVKTLIQYCSCYFCFFSSSFILKKKKNLLLI